MITHPVHSLATEVGRRLPPLWPVRQGDRRRFLNINTNSWPSAEGPAERHSVWMQRSRCRTALAAASSTGDTSSSASVSGRTSKSPTMDYVRQIRHCNGCHYGEGQPTWLSCEWQQHYTANNYGQRAPPGVWHQAYPPHLIRVRSLSIMDRYRRVRSAGSFGETSILAYVQLVYTASSRYLCRKAK